MILYILYVFCILFLERQRNMQEVPSLFQIYILDYPYQQHKNQTLNSFWIKDLLPRRGIVAGKYQLVKIHKGSNFHEFNEIISPQLTSNEKILNPSIEASNNIEKDIISLINFSQYCHDSNLSSDWRKTLPIYPTSPIDNK